MQVGITGHQERPGIDWGWVEQALRFELSKLRGVDAAFSSLAKGADQIFARVAISLNIPVIAVIPVKGYERFFHATDRSEYDLLLRHSRIIDLEWRGDDQSGFFAAGKFIAENADLIFAVWDGKKSKGLGGTADIVEYASHISKRVIHLNPLFLSTREIARNENG